MPYPQSTSVAHRPAPGDRPWIFAGAGTLAAVAGYVNVVVLGVFAVPVSHMSGAVSRLGIDLAAGNRADLTVILAIVLGFLAGAVLSGAIIGNRKLVPGRRYGFALFLEGGVLAVATSYLYAGHSAGIVLAAMACGIQNAMASSYYGLVIRTTHVTGIVTDIGVIIGYWIRGRTVRVWKLLLLVVILTGFFTGGFLGAVMYAAIGRIALALASAGCVTAGATYFLWRHLRRHTRFRAARSRR